MIKGIGIDIVEKRRIQDILERLGTRFIQRILTAEEQSIMPEGKARSEFIAGRFAAKEAFAKATGFGFGKLLSFQDILVLRDSLGKPILQLSEKWAGKHNPHGSFTIHVSISHEKKYAVAQVIIEC